jgi:hypothetical protein
MSDNVKKLENRIEKKGFSFYIVNEAGHRISSTWVIKKDIRKKDGFPSIYLYQRTFGGKMKLSLHSDHCQWGMKDIYAEENKRKGWGTFAPIVWKRKMTPDNGALYVASIRFATDFLKGDFSQYQETKKPVCSFRAAPPGKSINMGIFFSKEKPESLNELFSNRGAELIVSFDLENGEHVSIVATIQDNPHKMPAEFNGGSKIGREIEPVLENGETINNVSAVLTHQRPVDGTPLELVEIGGLSLGK